MSSISSAGSSLFQFFKRLDAVNSSRSSDATAAAAAAAAGGAANPDSAGATQAPDGTSNQPLQGHRHHHQHAGGARGAQFFKKLQDAVTGALQQAKESGGSADPNQVVQDAIQKVVTQQGATQSGGATSSGPDVRPSDADHGSNDVGAGNHASSSGALAGGGRDAFFAALQSFGIDPAQFHNDFLAAVHEARGGGSADAGAAFKSFPPGAQVDTTA